MKKNNLLDPPKCIDNVNPMEDKTILVTTYDTHDQVVPKLIAFNLGKVTIHFFSLRNMS